MRDERRLIQWQKLRACGKGADFSIVMRPPSRSGASTIVLLAARRRGGFIIIGVMVRALKEFVHVALRLVVF